MLLFGLQGEQIIRQPTVIALLAVPILIQVYFNAGLAYWLNRRLGVAWCVAGPSALIGASNFFELAVATAIALFGFQSGAALSTVVGVLVEVPVMLSVVQIVRRSRGWYERGAWAEPETMLPALDATISSRPTRPADRAGFAPSAAHPAAAWLAAARSYSRFLADEAERLLVAMGCETRRFDPPGCRCPMPSIPSHPKVQELRALSLWSEGQVWSSPERHGTLSGIMKCQIDWLPLSEGGVRPTQGRTLAVMQVSGGSQSFNAVNAMRLLGRWMGATPAAAIAAGAFVGPAQVAARLAEFGLLRWASPMISAHRRRRSAARVLGPSSDCQDILRWDDRRSACLL